MVAEYGRGRLIWQPEHAHHPRTLLRMGLPDTPLLHRKVPARTKMRKRHAEQSRIVQQRSQTQMLENRVVDTESHPHHLAEPGHHVRVSLIPG